MVKEFFNNIIDFKLAKQLLSLDNEEEINQLHCSAREIRNAQIGNKVYLRGLIEYSNRCSKNCYYCGIRGGNKNAVRYELGDEEVVNAAIFSHKNGYGSIVLQSGERSDRQFTSSISRLIKKIHQATDNSLRITLSCGEQTEEVFREWFELGASRYLLRIESSNPELYKKLHPNNANHSFQHRIEAINDLIRIGYQTGTGVMIGLPFQTIDDLANDLIFIRNSGVHMVGMGPYIEHHETPLFEHRDKLLSSEKRFELALKMIAILRIMRPTINIASTTALQTLDSLGREKGLLAGANVIMPNITPISQKINYNLYEGKPFLNDKPEDVCSSIEQLVKISGCEVAYGEWGDSNFYKAQNMSS